MLRYSYWVPSLTKLIANMLLGLSFMEQVSGRNKKIKREPIKFTAVKYCANPLFYKIN